MKSGQAGFKKQNAVFAFEFAERQLWRSVLVFVALASIALNGCAGLVSGANPTSPSAPSTLNITNVQIVSSTTSSSQIAWTTNIAADSSVDYGTTANYGFTTAVDPTMVTTHTMSISGLTPNTTYYYQVSSTDSQNNHGKSGGHTLKTSGLSISGAVSPATGANGATVALTGPASATTTADSSGNYAFTGLSNGTYAVAPSRSGYTFSPNSQNVTLNGANVTGVNFTDSPQTFSISGTITPNPGGNGALVTLSGAASGTTRSTATGNYTFTGLGGGSYTLTPSNTGYTFSPASQNVSVNSANVTGVNFTDSSTAVAPTITTQPANQTVTAGQAATFTVLAMGTATLTYQWQKNGVNISGATSASYTTPSTTTTDSGSTFRVVVSNAAGTANSTAATLTVSAATAFSISGTISPTAGGGGATVTLSGAATATTTANGAGAYTFTGLANGTYAVTPSHSGYTFSPSSQSATVNGANVTGLNFTGTAQTFSLSGTINPGAGGSGAMVALSGGASATTTTNSSGAYTFGGLVNGSYTVTPTNTGYTFTPPSQNVTINGTNSTGVNFTAVVAQAHSATANWTVSTSPVSGYNVYRGAVSGGPYAKVNGTLISALTYTDSTVAAGQTYYYVATAVDASGNESVYSNEVQAVIP